MIMSVVTSCVRYCDMYMARSTGNSWVADLAVECIWLFSFRHIYLCIFLTFATFSLVCEAIHCSKLLVLTE